MAAEEPSTAPPVDDLGNRFDLAPSPTSTPRPPLAIEGVSPIVPATVKAYTHIDVAGAMTSATIDAGAVPVAASVSTGCGLAVAASEGG